MVKLSIIITTQNRLNILQKCLKSIFTSTGISSVKEIVIVDDGSADDTQYYLKDLIKKNNIISFIRNEKIIWPAAARNQGINSVKGDYTFIMGDDVVLSENTIEIFCRHILKYKPEKSSIIGNILPEPENITPFEHWSCNGGSQFGHYKIPKEKRLDAGEEYFYTSNVITPTWILKKYQFDEGFPYARYEDRELSYRLKKAIDHKIHYVPNAISYHCHKLPFKEWLQKFYKFTFAAIYFSNKYPDDKELRTKLGISKAIETETFNYSALVKAAELINSNNKFYFDSESIFGQSWIIQSITSSFRVLQEFFRISFIREHLKLSPLINGKENIDSKTAMDNLISFISDDI